MMEESERIQAIEDFLFQRLPPQEQEAFAQRMAVDTELAREVRLHAEAIAGIRMASRKMLKQQLMGLEERLAANEVTERTPVRRLFPRWIWQAAATVVLLLGGVFYYLANRASSENDLFLRYYEPYPNVVASVNRGEEPKDAKAKALQAYERGDYRQASQALETLHAKFPTDAAITFYLGQAYLGDNHMEKAVESLQGLAKSSNDFTLQAQWYLSLIYLKQNERQKARPLLETLSKETGPYGAKAKALLGEI
jgi:tetratricopeptide (TPR) repeat protein